MTGLRGRERESDDDGDKAREIFVVLPPPSLLLMEDLTPARQARMEGAIVIVELHNNTFLPSSWSLALLLPFLFIIFLGLGIHTG